MTSLGLHAIVLRTVDYGEADRIVTLLTREQGKLSALARGARKSARRFGSALGLFGVGEAMLRARRGAELYHLDSFHPRRSFAGILADLAKVAHAGYGCELVRELAPAEQAEPELFDLLLELLILLDASPARAETLRLFELKLLDAIGLRPVVDRCIGCEGDNLDGPGQVFDPRRGGIVCGACQARARSDRSGALPFASRARRALQGALELRLADARELSFAPEVNAACREALHALLHDHLGRPLKSLEFIAKLNAVDSRELTVHSKDEKKLSTLDP